MQSTDFLQAITLLATRERRLVWNEGDSDKPPAVSCKRKDILKLTHEEYERWAPAVEKGFLWAAAFLTGEMIFEARDVPYRTQLVPLAAIHVALGASAEAIGKVEKIRRWYWCGVLGEFYGGATETRFANDLQQVTEWCSGAAAEPITVYESSFDPGRLLTLRTRNSAAYKGIYALLMRGGSKDWLYDQDITIATHYTLAVDIHHIFPKKWCIDRRSTTCAGKASSTRRRSRLSPTGESAVRPPASTSQSCAKRQRRLPKSCVEESNSTTSTTKRSQRTTSMVSSRRDARASWSSSHRRWVKRYRIRGLRRSQRTMTSKMRSPPTRMS